MQADSAYHVFDNKTAAALYEEALTIDSTHFDVLVKASRTNYDLGLDLVAEGQTAPAFNRFELAIIRARSLVSHFPDSAQSHFLLAATMGNLALFKNGREKILLGRLVEQHSKKAIELDPAFAYPYVSLGIYYRELSRLTWLEKTLAKVFFGRLPNTSLDEALNHLSTALRLRPQFPFLHFELALTFLSVNRNEEAIDHLNTLVSLQPENSQDIRNQEYAVRLLKELEERDSK